MVKGASETLSESFTQIGDGWPSIMLSGQHTLSALAVLLIAMACTNWAVRKGGLARPNHRRKKPGSTATVPTNASVLIYLSSKRVVCDNLPRLPTAAHCRVYRNSCAISDRASDERMFALSSRLVSFSDDVIDSKSIEKNLEHDH
jgi:hypothetical protein